jgi:hypothetical protein
MCLFWSSIKVISLKKLGTLASIVLLSSTLAGKGEYSKSYGSCVVEDSRSNPVLRYYAIKKGDIKVKKEEKSKDVVTYYSSGSFSEANYNPKNLEKACLEMDLNKDKKVTKHEAFKALNNVQKLAAKGVYERRNKETKKWQSQYNDTLEMNNQGVKEKFLEDYLDIAHKGEWGFLSPDNCSSVLNYIKKDIQERLKINVTDFEKSYQFVCPILGTKETGKELWFYLNSK